MTSYHAFGEVDQNTPAVIIETGFMNQDRDLLTNNPSLVARGITAGIMCYLNREEISPGQ
jgi:N-acetylmuramoyl-L-alanine amidase